MGGKKENKALKRLLSLALAFALVFTLTPLAGGLVADTAYADTTYTDGITVKLSKVSCDTMNDEVVLMVEITDLEGDGISGIDFRVNFPDAFELTEIENMNYFGEGKGEYPDAVSTNANERTYAYTSSIQGPNTNETNFYLGFYSMNTAEGKDVCKTAGDVAKLTFKVQKGRTLAAGKQEFSLSKIKAYRVVVKDGLPTSAYPTVVGIDASGNTTADGTAGYSYVSIGSSDATTSGSTLTVKNCTDGTAIIKTDALATAITSVSDSNKAVTLDLSSVNKEGEKADTSASNATVTATTLQMSKTSAGEIAKKNNDATMTLKTSGASLNLNNTALDSIAARTGGEKLVIEVKQENKIKISTDTSAAGATGVVYDVTAKLVSAEPDGSKTAVENVDITHFGGGVVTVTLDIPSDLQNETDKLKCYYINESKDNKKTYSEVDGTVSDDKTKYSFTTNHFSKYVLATSENMDKYVTAIDAKPACTISGTVTSYGEAGDVTLTLSKGTKVIDSQKANAAVKKGTTGNEYYTNDYTLNLANSDDSALEAGDYTLEISKAGHATLTKTIEITEANKTSSIKVEDASIYLYGDVTNDGKITADDAQQVQRYAARLSNNINTAYKIKLANANGNGKLTAADAQEIQRKAAGLSSTIDTLK